MARSLSSFLALLVLVACVSRMHVMTIQFDPAMDYWSQQPGTARVEGQAFARTRGGDVKLCSGYPVQLIPDNPYIEERFEALKAGATTFSDGTAADKAFRRVTQCNAQGNFEFEDLPPGKWIVEGKVRWEAPSEWGPTQQGGYISKHIETQAGKTTKVILSD